MDITPSRIRFISVAALTLCACAAVSSFPAVLSVSLEQMSTASQLIFEGEVIGTASHFNALGYPFNRTHPGRQFSRGGSLEGDPGSAGARAPGAAWATPPGAAWWR